MMPFADLYIAKLVPNSGSNEFVAHHIDIADFPGLRKEGGRIHVITILY
jgi:hypothetical protein